ncbi:response regulator transcription factor [Parachryseolinea silvisoli]|jgi:two-component system response regulator DegU|uniref:response regulator transcription factor n=1 Tax=Parachryseolinea silvisoli TaxID=2873601 RepID=UPI002265B6B8|nr:response regulator transcription factor [Parachryseolinea silvisoli]MCD9016398.1 response regulator transcription factor [Parachryseolinea silvisoli]
MKKYKVYIADDHTLFRKAMVNLLRSFHRVQEVKDAENGKELLTLIKYEQPDVAIVDLQMPVMDGAETCEQIIKKHPDVKIIILTMHDSNKYILHMMEMGVHAFLLKNTEPDELEKAIYAVVEKDFYHNDLVAAVLRKNVTERKSGQRPQFRLAELTEREKEILVLICRELTIREIGQKLSLSENTVRNHRVNMMDKIGVNNTVGLVKFAYEAGIVS